MNNINNKNKIKENIKTLVSIIRQEGLDEGREFYEKDIGPLIDKIIKKDKDWYMENYEYFIEMKEMLYVYPEFGKPPRTKEESIAIIEEIFNKTG